MKFRHLLKILSVLCIMLISGCAPKATVIPSDEGLEMVLRVTQGEIRLREQIAGLVADMAKRRIKLLGIRKAVVETGKDATVVVRAFSIDDKEFLQNMVGKPVMLELRLVDEGFEIENATELLPPDRELLYGNELDQYTGAVNKVPYLTETGTVFQAGLYVKSAKLEKDPFNETYILVQLNMQGAALFAEFTADHVSRRVAVVIDDHVCFSAAVREKIQGGQLIIRGLSSEEEAAALAKILPAGPYPENVEFLGP